MKKGLFIALEGLDGSGKSTQGNIIKEYLLNKGYDVVFTREPGGTDVSERLREIILDKTITNMHPLTECYLYAAARCQIVHELIEPALNEGKIVICDRYVYSSIAYQGYGRNLGEDTVMDINKFAMDGVMPDLTIYFDMEKDNSRINREKDRMELNSDDFFHNVYLGYKAHYNDEKAIVVNAKESIESISKRLICAIEGLLNE